MVAYGSKGNPVAQDPFQQIVEVHWTSPYIAASLDLSLATVFEVQLGPGHGPTFVEPFSHYSTTLATYSFPIDGPLGSFSRLSGDSWENLPGGAMVSGEPSLPGPYSYGLWLWQGIDGAGLKEPFLQFQHGDEGEPLAPSVPGHSSVHFTDALAGNVILRAQGFAPGGPYDSPLGNDTAEMWATAQADGFAPILQDAETASLSVAGMTLEYQDKTYAAIGTKVVAEGGNGPGQFWVLFKRQAVVTP